MYELTAHAQFLIAVMSALTNWTVTPRNFSTVIKTYGAAYLQVLYGSSLSNQICDCSKALIIIACIAWFKSYLSNRVHRLNYRLVLLW